MHVCPKCGEEIKCEHTPISKPATHNEQKLLRLDFETLDPNKGCYLLDFHLPSSGRADGLSTRIRTTLSEKMQARYYLHKNGEQVKQDQISLEIAIKIIEEKFLPSEGVKCYIIVESNGDKPITLISLESTIKVLRNIAILCNVVDALNIVKQFVHHRTAAKPDKDRERRLKRKGEFGWVTKFQRSDEQEPEKEERFTPATTGKVPGFAPKDVVEEPSEEIAASEETPKAEALAQTGIPAIREAIQAFAPEKQYAIFKQNMDKILMMYNEGKPKEAENEIRIMKFCFTNEQWSEYSAKYDEVQKTEETK